MNSAASSSAAMTMCASRSTSMLRPPRCSAGRSRSLRIPLWVRGSCSQGPAPSRRRPRRSAGLCALRPGRGCLPFATPAASRITSTTSALSTSRGASRSSRWPERHVQPRVHGRRLGIGSHDHARVPVAAPALANGARLLWDEALHRGGPARSAVAGSVGALRAAAANKPRPAAVRVSREARHGPEAGWQPAAPGRRRGERRAEPCSEFHALFSRRPGPTRRVAAASPAARAAARG